MWRRLIDNLRPLCIQALEMGTGDERYTIMRRPRRHDVEEAGGAVDQEIRAVTRVRDDPGVCNRLYGSETNSTPQAGSNGRTFLLGAAGRGIFLP